MVIRVHAKSDDSQDAIRNVITAAETYIRAATDLLALFAISYAVLIIVFGSELWFPGDTLYNNALQIPGAPLTWGIVAALSGCSMLICSRLKHGYKNDAWMLVSCVVMALWSFCFAFTILIDIFEFRAPQGWPAVLTLGVFWLAYTNRAVLAWTRLRNPIEPSVTKDTSNVAEVKNTDDLESSS